MTKKSVFERMRDLIDDLTGKNKFGKLDFGTLKVMMMLAAVDGEVAVGEVGRFREMAAKCRGYSGESFESLWDSAVRSAGYLLLQARLLPEDELVAAFVREAEKDFVCEVIQEVARDRDEAFARLASMAAADGDCSDIERRCIETLAKRVKEARDRALAERYPRATVSR